MLSYNTDTCTTLWQKDEAAKEGFSLAFQFWNGWSYLIFHTQYLLAKEYINITNLTYVPALKGHSNKDISKADCSHFCWYRKFPTRIESNCVGNLTLLL